MPQPLLDASTSMLCPHGGTVTHVPSQVRVTLNGVPALTVADMGTVVGCAFTIPTSKPSPCTTVQYTAPAVRVRLSGQPALLATSVGMCKSPEQAPQGPAIVTSPQPRVLGT